MTAPITTRPGRIAWFVLAYRLPASSGLKATIRRKLTAMGAVYPVKAVAALPASSAAERSFRRRRKMIGEGGGSAQVLHAEAIEGSRTAWPSTRPGSRNTARSSPGAAMS